MVKKNELSEMLKAKREGNEPNKDEISKKNLPTKKCPECRMENMEDAKFCIGCGYNFVEKDIKESKVNESPKTKTCPSCNSNIPENAKFCVVCGETQIKTPEDDTSTKKAPSLDSNIKDDTLQDQPKLIIQELTLNSDGLKFNNLLKVEGLYENEIMKYENIEKTEFADDTLTIYTADGIILIEGLNQDLGNEFASCVQDLVEKSKPKIDPESMDKIQKAKDLLEIGAIDEEEFENIKRKILKEKIEM